MHFAEFTQYNFLNKKDDPTDLYEVMSSGLTHRVGMTKAVNGFIRDTKNVFFLINN